MVEEGDGGKPEVEEGEKDFPKTEKASVKKEDEDDPLAEGLPEQEDPDATLTTTGPDTGGIAETPPSTATSPAVEAWQPNNSGPPPVPVSQADLKMVCQQMGPGLEAGYVRYGCNAMRTDGKHYGIVKGWWQVVRGDGVRAKSKALNFREGGFDMAVDVLSQDAAAGIAVKPGSGELAIRIGR